MGECGHGFCFRAQITGIITSSFVPAGPGLIVEIFFTICSPPHCRAFGRDLLEGKSKSPLFASSGGVLTNAYCTILVISWLAMLVV